MIFLGIILSAGVIIALSIRLPLQQIMAAMHAITSGDYNREVQGTKARDEVGAMARAVEVFRENAIAKRETEDELRTAIAIDPSAKYLHFNLGVVLLRAGRDADGVAELKAELEMRPDGPHAPRARQEVQAGSGAVGMR